MKNKSLTILLSFLVMLGYSGELISSDQESFKKLKKISRVLSYQGFTCRTRVDGRYLRTGQTYTFYTTLYSENVYRLVAAGNVHVKDIDVELHDENHNVIARDRDSDAIPIVAVAPKWTGEFHAKVTMYRGRGYSNVMVCWKKK